MKPLKPMLGANCERSVLEEMFLSGRTLLVSYKLDGIRALIKDGVVLSRSLKPIPNRHIQKLYGRPEYEGFDGELIVGSRTASDVFRVTTSGVMSEDGEPDVCYWVFDIWNMTNTPMHDRAAQVISRVLTLSSDEPVHALAQVTIRSLDALDKKFTEALAAGYEGLVMRNPFGLYKYGRSTVKEAGLLKMKPFKDAEATVIGRVELMHNENEAFTNEVGRTARSTAKAGKVPGGVLGALVCRTTEGIEFEVGSGFTAEQRAEYWRLDHLIMGRIVTYKYLDVGIKEKPRSPIFKGFRDQRDT